MITSELKSRIGKFWTDFWTGGITNPLTVIEQISFLVFARLLDITETRNEKRAARTGRPFKRIFGIPPSLLPRLVNPNYAETPRVFVATAIGQERTWEGLPAIRVRQLMNDQPLPLEFAPRLFALYPVERV